MRVKRILALAMCVILSISAMSISAFAYIENNGYQSATTVSLSQTVTTDKITSASDEKWYKFSITQANAPYTLAVYNAPSAGAYRCELRYQQTSGTRPVIINSSGTLTGSNKWTMRGVLRNTGTYYVRVYSATGAYSSSAYAFSTSISYSMHSSTTNIPSVTGDSSRDWAVCAEVVGKYAYMRDCGIYPDRTSTNAMKFIKSNGLHDTSSSVSITNMVKPSLENVAIATNYIYSGDYMSNPMFAADHTTFTTADFAEQIWKLSKIDNADHTIIKLNLTDYPIDRFSIYYVLLGANTGSDTIRVRECDGTMLTIDYTDLVTGFGDDNEYTYQGENVIRVGY